MAKQEIVTVQMPFPHFNASRLPSFRCSHETASATVDVSPQSKFSSSLLTGPSFDKKAMSEPNKVKQGPLITKSGQTIEKLRIFVGFDVREELAYEVCRHSLLKHATVSIEIIPLKLQILTNQGVYKRPRDPTESTEFSFTRFLTPFLAGFQGWAMFVDCDFLYTADVRELVELIDEQYAIMCVHHDYNPKTTVKMDGVLQTCYPRKNWSSMVLYNCAHPKNQLLTPELVNSASGAFLHRFMWLEDSDIGELPTTWNFLVGHNETPEEETTPPKAIHFTSGGPWFEAWKDCEFAEIWRKARDQYWSCRSPSLRSSSNDIYIPESMT